MRALAAAPVEEPVEEPVEQPIERKRDKPAKRDKLVRYPAPEDNGPIVSVGFGVTPSAEQSPAAADEQGDANDQGESPAS